MAPQPTNPGQSPSGSQPTGGIQLPRFPASAAARPTNLGQPPAASNTSNQKTWQAPRFHQGEALSETTKSPITDDFRKPLKRVGLAMGLLFLTILFMSLIYNAIAGLFHRDTTTPQAVSSPTASVSTDPDAAARVTPDGDNCNGITAKMKTAQVSSQQVNRLFWQKYPAKTNKALDLSLPADRALGQEWCKIAGELSTPKP
jgi:hypothetical protein